MNIFTKLLTRWAAEARHPQLEDALDRCVDEIVLHGATVEDCLDRWPAFREELGPLLRATESLVAGGRDAPSTRALVEHRRALLREVADLPRRPARHPRGSVGNETSAAWRRLMPRSSILRGALAATFGVMVLGAAIFVVPAPAPAAAATLSVMGGEVEIFEHGRWASLTGTVEVHPGALLRTGADGRALIEFRAGTMLVEPDATFRVIEVAASAGETTVVQVDAGRAWIDLSLPGAGADGPAALWVETPFGRFDASEASFELNVAPARAALAVDRGEIEARRDGIVRALGRGRHTVVPVPSPASAPSLTVEHDESADEGTLTIQLRGNSAVRLVDPRGVATESSGGGSRHLIPRAVVEGAPGGARVITVQSPSGGSWRLVVEPGHGQETVTFVYEGVEYTAPLGAGAASGPVEIEFEVAPGEHGQGRLRMAETAPGRGGGGPPGSRPGR